MGPACKAIIDNGVAALNETLYTVLTHPLVRDVMVPADQCDKMLHKLACVDIAAYRGLKFGEVPHTLTDILLELEKAGAVTADVWEIYRHPGNPPVPAGA